ncbi:MAG TPA: DUF4382 domain-containing protein [Solimonas sp.]|nr:DUF4382 domain-containing protein [Solimonas sp.]
MNLRLPFLLLTATLAACESSLDVDLATANFEDAKRIEVRLEGVELRDDSGGIVSIEADDPGLVDLLDYQGSALLRLVSDVEVPARNYQSLRLLLSDDDAELEEEDGDVRPIRLAASQPFLPVDFSLDDDGSETLLAVLDLRFSLADRSASSGDYSLRQQGVAGLAGEVGTLRGSVDESYVSAGACAGIGDDGYAVYLFEGQRTAGSDFFADADDNPVVSASVLRNAGESDYRYAFRGLTEGDYTLVFTCQADLDDPESRQTLVFREPVAVEIEAGSETQKDL